MESASPQEVNDSIFITQSFNRSIFRLTPKKCIKIPRRYIMMLLMSIGLFIVHWMRQNYIIASFHIIINKKTNALYPNQHEFGFDEIASLQAALIWAHFAGQIPGTILATIFPPHRTFVSSVALCCAFHFFWPLAVNHKIGAAVGVHVMQGLLEGPLYPCCYAMMTQWVPYPEKTRLIAIITAGKHFGSFVGYLFSDLLVEALGEEIGFYSSAISGFLWCILWGFYTFESPSEDPFMSQEELHYLQENINTDVKVPVTLKSIQYKSILASVPVWTLCLTSGWCMFLIYVIQFVPQILSFSGHGYGEKYHQRVALTFFPDICSGFMLPIFGLLADLIIAKRWLDTGKTRRIFGFIAFNGIFVLILIAACIKQSISLTILVHVSTFFIALATVGNDVNYLDICPRHAVFVRGFIATIQYLVAAFLPYLLKHIIINEFDKKGTGGVTDLLFAVSGVSCVVGIVFWFFASGDQQEWDKISNHSQNVTRGREEKAYPQNLEDDSTLIHHSTML